MRPDLMRAVQAFQDDIVRFAQKLIQTPSLSGAEGRIAELTQREMERLGYDRTWRDEVGNVIGLMKGEDGGKSVMLNSHLDHVDVGDQSQWEFPPYGAIVADDFIWGRAACDVKGALPVQIYVPAIARKAGLRVPSDVGIRLDIQRLLASFDSGGLERRDGSYYSDNWDSARYHLRIHISATFGAVVVDRSGPSVNY